MRKYIRVDNFMLSEMLKDMNNVIKVKKGLGSIIREFCFLSGKENCKGKYRRCKHV